VNEGRTDLPVLFTVAETAQLLRTSRKAIYVMAERGVIPGVTRIGRRILFRTSDLLEWLDHNRTPSLEERR
jgi:excisionase family DNA binding protein